jgi:hypothetical protein
MIINRIYENQNLLSLYLLSFLVGLRTYQHPCIYQSTICNIPEDLKLHNFTITAMRTKIYQI